MQLQNAEIRRYFTSCTGDRLTFKRVNPLDAAEVALNYGYDNVEMFATYEADKVVKKVAHRRPS